MKAEAPPHLRRGRQIAAGGKADAGAIHCAQADKIKWVAPPLAAPQTKERTVFGLFFLLFVAGGFTPPGPVKSNGRSAAMRRETQKEGHDIVVSFFL
ncbi:hypothetical protein GMD88_06270 [Pseudoflavonifractor sp. BIOML-A6]|nr:MULTISPECIES: hypothetical protein [unclassified Pseudoflavonifractor]MTQ96399.1 hypothetical protein [Pseudoflavonifractor sp. BIOML-A16]MTR05160.1 hypothetical protein [Pseudoflavonifractor sp. BIOML-A15]MTR32505.1 hypothetical protein [Pseudoflavonifractor sp. BIOML-A14]MTR73775.1 hypothetical protein [Pseudoflavonifractor sp. BIOML-A18]MTS63148.1 hypothetical protein [Pseudoflavonifractor sp. BIOML-A5]MTS70515.1 hypothetical protein [Pseudoflavonifractor sp. BIOML-A8]MTS92079.1 hypoth